MTARYMDDFYVHIPSQVVEIAKCNSRYTVTFCTNMLQCIVHVAQIFGGSNLQVTFTTMSMNLWTDPCENDLRPFPVKLFFYSESEIHLETIHYSHNHGPKAGEHEALGPRH